MEINKRIEPPLNDTGTNLIYYNEEWNHPREGDEDHEDFVDSYTTQKEDTTYYDDYEDYGN
jgi:hypothetical protein